MTYQAKKSKEWEEQREVSPKCNMLICFFSFRSVTSSGIVHTCVYFGFVLVFILNIIEIKIEEKSNVRVRGYVSAQGTVVGKRKGKAKEEERDSNEQNKERLRNRCQDISLTVQKMRQ